MRRKDREISDINESLEILDKCKVCRIGLSDNNMPYIVPLNYGYTWENDRLTLYFHSALEGKKIDILKNNKRACFEIDTDHRLIEGVIACKYGYSYSSIMGFGNIEFINDNEEKTRCLNILMKHQTGQDTLHAYSDEALAGIVVYKLVAEDFSCKKRK